MIRIEIDVDRLRLDYENPRLPASVPRDPDAILDYILKNGALQELAHSFVDNGFFEAERLIVLSDTSEPGAYIVVEGNRRLATLQILHDSSSAPRLVESPLDVTTLQRLKKIPCLEVNSRAEVDRYLAYRHIGGMKTWSSEARARFTKRLVEKAVANREVDPFKAVGRQIGSNAQGVRSSFLAILLLEHGREELGIFVDYLLHERFGVWLRCMTSTEIRGYMGIDNPRTHSEVVTAVNGVDGKRLKEVIADLSLGSDGRKPLVADSRDITVYSRILMDESANDALRKHSDFEVARQLVEERSLPGRIDRISKSISAIIDLVPATCSRLSAQELKQPINDLFSKTKALRAVVNDLVDNEDD